jgi:hypothetical protein
VLISLLGKVGGFLEEFLREKMIQCQGSDGNLRRSLGEVWKIEKESV